MAAQQKKKRFSIFGSPLPVPISPNTSSLLSNYFSTTPIRDEKFPTPDDVRKAVENLERIVLAANDYCDSIDKLSKASKTFSKSLKDYGNIRGMDTSHVTCFQATSQFYENCAEVQSKLNKSIQKDFETLQKLWDKYSKKVTKEEKAHEDYIDDLDRQLNKITVDYDKKIKKDNKTSTESHEKYMNSVTVINSDITRARREYAAQVSKRERNTHDIIAQIICRMVENQNNSFDDSKRKGGPSVTKINEISHLIGACTQSSQDDNEDSIISKPAKEIAMITRRLSRRASHKVSQSIASISELQIAAMNYLSSDLSKHSTEEQEECFLKSSPPPQIPALIPPDPINLQFNQPISIVSEESITLENDRPKENVIKSNSPVSLTSNLDIPLQPSISTPLTVKPKTPDLISKISIGIHEDDRPFFRDYDINFSSNDNVDTINDNQDLSNALQSSEKPQSEIKNKKRLSIITGNNFSNNDTNNVGGEIDQSKEETKPDSNSEKQLNPEYSFDTRNNFDSERVEIERKIESKKRERLQHIFSQSDGNIKYAEKYNDEPSAFVSTNDYQSETICSSPTSTNNEDVDKQNSKFQRFDDHSATSSSLSITSDAAESEKPPRTRASYNLSPRRAYTDYPLPINTNKRAGPSVADLRERLLSLSNDNKEKTPTTPRSSVPISKQGHVITLLSKFDAEGSNSRQSPRSSNHSKSDDYFFRGQDLRSGDYNYNNHHYEDDIDRNNNEFKDEMYIDHTRGDEHVLSSSPGKQEECDCHICQQVTEKVNSSLDPQDDSSTFGRRSFCESNSNT